MTILAEPIKPLIDGVNALLALTRDENLREQAFNNASYPFLPQTIKDLGNYQPKHFCLEKSKNLNFDHIFGNFFYLIENSLNFVDQNGDIGTEFEAILQILSNIMRIFNNICFIETISDQILFKSALLNNNPENTNQIPLNLTIVLGVLTMLFELLFTKKVAICIDILPQFVISQCVSIVEKNVEKTQNNPQIPPISSKLLSNPVLLDLLKLFTVVSNTFIQQTDQQLEIATKRDIFVDFFTISTQQKFQKLPYNYQILQCNIVTTLLYVWGIYNSVGFENGQCCEEKIDNKNLIFSTFSNLLTQMTQLSISIIPHTSTSESIQYGLQHPFSMSINGISHNLLELFFGENDHNFDQIFTFAEKNTKNSKNSKNTKNSKNWLKNYTAIFTQNFNQSNLFQNILTIDSSSTPSSTNHLPQWGLNITTQSPNLTTLLYLLISSPTLSSPQPTSTLNELYLSPSNGDVYHGDITVRIRGILLKSIPLFLNLISDFSSNQITACYNTYNVPTDASSLNNNNNNLSNSGITITDTSGKPPKNNNDQSGEKNGKNIPLTPAELKTQQAKSQLIINTNISNFFVSSTSLAVLYLSIVADVRKTKSQKNHSSTSFLFSDLTTEFLTTASDIWSTYQDNDDEDGGHSADSGDSGNEEINGISVNKNCINLLDTILDNNFPSIWNDDLLTFSAENNNIQNFENFDEEFLSEINPIILIEKMRETSISPLFSTKSILKSLTTAIMCCKYIATPQSGATLTQQQQIAQQQQVVLVANDQTPPIQAQQHFNYLTRHVYPYIFAELIYTIVDHCEFYRELIDFNFEENQSDEKNNTNRNKPQNYQLVLLQTLLQSNIVCISDLFTALAPLALSSLPCQFLLHSTEPMVVILSFIQIVVSFFLGLPITTNETKCKSDDKSDGKNDGKDIIFKNIQNSFPSFFEISQITQQSPVIPDINPLFTIFEQIFMGDDNNFDDYSEQNFNSSKKSKILPLFHTKNATFPPHQNQFLKIFSSLCYRGMTLLGYFVGNGLPPPLSQQQLEQHAQLKIINKYLISPSMIFINLHFCYFYIKNFIFKQINPKFKTKKFFFSYQLSLRNEPPIIEVIEGILTLLLNSSLFLQRKPIEYDDVYPFVSDTPMNNTIYNNFFSSKNNTENTPNLTLLHPLLLITTPTMLSFLIRILTLGWDGDNSRFGPYLDPDVVTLVTPHAYNASNTIRNTTNHDNSDNSDGHPKEMKLLLRLFHKLFYRSVTCVGKRVSSENSVDNIGINDDSGDRNGRDDDFKHDGDYDDDDDDDNNNNDMLNAEIGEKIIRTEFFPSQLDSIPSHILQHKLPNFQAPVLRLLRSIFDIFLKIDTNQQQNNKILTAPTLFNTFTPLRISDLLVSLYALTVYCPIPTLRYESARTFGFLSRIFAQIQTHNAMKYSAERIKVGLQSLIQNKMNQIDQYMPAFDVNRVYINDICGLETQIGHFDHFDHNTVSLTEFIQLINSHPYIFAPTTTSNNNGPKIKPKGIGNKTGDQQQPQLLNRKNNKNNSNLIEENKKVKIFQDLLRILLSVNGSSPDGQLLLQEAHSALRALGMTQ
jgi:hypothetical protein